VLLSNDDRSGPSVAPELEAQTFAIQSGITDQANALEGDAFESTMAEPMPSCSASDHFQGRKSRPH
jgi:hypothetical protein